MNYSSTGAPAPASAFSLRPYQAAKVTEARALMGSGKKSICLVSPTGSGKCLGKGTSVLMYDGKIKSVEDIRPGDRLMGPDSTPRHVLSVCSGVEMLYRVTPKKGDSYVVNASHILSLKRTHEQTNKKTRKRDRGGEIVNLSVTEYLAKSATFRNLHKGWRTGVEFESRELLMIDPYFLGIWLGDGTQRTSAITTGDQEVVDWIIGYATSLKLETRIENNSENSVGVHITTGYVGGGRGKNPLVYALDRHGLRQRKHIPHAYKTASRADRLKLLAGFIDADGSLSNGGYDVVGINEELIDDIIFVARSLGFSAYKSACKKTCCNNGKEGDYFRCNIGGHTDEIPCLIARKQASPRRQKKSVLVTGISVEPIGEGDYYGFEIDGDRLFMLGDFTVTHNTIIAVHIIHSALAKGKSVLFMAHRRELLNQCAAKLRDLGICNYNVVLSGHPESRNPNAPVQIASIQTLIRRKYPPADLVILDECHHAAAAQYQTILKHYPDAYVLGLTATPERLDGKGLDGIFHDLLEVATVPELIEQGFLVKPTCLGPSPDMVAQLKATLATVKVRCGDYAEDQLGEAMDNATLVGDIVAHWQKWALGQKTIVFAASILHSKHIVQQFQDAGVSAAHLDGGMSAPERERILSAWRRGDYLVLSNVQICTEGVDFPELSCCILARPTKSIALFLQMVGRVLRPAPGKSGALILDHAGNILEHGPPHIERVWTLQGAAKKRKVEKTHACFLPGCGALFVERDAGSVWWVATAQPGIAERYRFMAHKFERMDRSAAAFSQEAKLLVCPACSHASCKFCGSFIQPPSAESHDRLACTHCGGEYSSDRQAAENQGKRKPPECADGSLVLIDGDGPATEKIRVKNEYHRLLNIAREKGYKRGWVWWQLKKQFGDHQLRAGLPAHRAAWWRKGAAGQQGK